MNSFKEQAINFVNSVPFVIKAIGKRTIYKLKADGIFKLSLVGQPFQRQIGIDVGNRLEATACIRAKGFRKRFSGEQSQYTLLHKREVDQGLRRSLQYVVRTRRHDL